LSSGEVTGKERGVFKNGVSGGDVSSVNALRRITKAVNILN